MTSGKGGTGKTTCTGAISSALAKLGHSTVCVDCDIGLKNLDLVLGLSDSSVWDFSDVMEGRTTLDIAIVPHPDIENLYFLPAPSNISPEDIDPAAFKELIAELKDRYEYCLLDSPAGLGCGFRLAADNADSAIVVSTADASSLRDGQRTVSSLYRSGVKDIRLLVNRVCPQALRTVKATIDDVIDVVGARLIGLVSEDESVPLAANMEVPLLEFGAKKAYDQFMRIARRIAGERIPLGKF